MPELSFVLPHWVYWTGLIAFPLITMLLFRARRRTEQVEPVSMPLAYGLLVTGGFIGVHRLYLKSPWAFSFILIFVAILFVNVEVRLSRDAVSAVNNQIAISESRLGRAERALEKGKSGAEERIAQATQKLEVARAEATSVLETNERWNLAAKGLGGTLLLLLLIDVFLIPGLVKKCNREESGIDHDDVFECPHIDPHDRPVKSEPFAFNRWVDQLNDWVGEFVAYWSIIAVGVYYYEVMARYVFNSPTNWAHESMFLMFGMQYLLAGGYVLREGAHVRVDVLYMHFSERTKAIVDLITSVFFFIYVLALLVTGWTFFMDAYRVQEVSFTEWGIQYWPIKLSLSAGAVLLLLQGITLVLRDFATVMGSTDHNEEVTHGA